SSVPRSPARTRTSGGSARRASASRRVAASPSRRTPQCRSAGKARRIQLPSSPVSPPHPAGRGAPAPYSEGRRRRRPRRPAITAGLKALWTQSSWRGRRRECVVPGGEPSVPPKEVLALIREKEVRAVDLRFMDFPGLWQHFTIPADALDEAVFEEGLGFDGSSIRGWKAINESDMLVIPQADTAFIDPFCRERTLTMICNIHDPLDKTEYERDPRNVARKAVNFMKQSGIADTAYFGPELEFFVFDDVRYDQTQYSGYYYLDSVE